MATQAKSGTLLPPKAPNLPIGPVDYDQRYQDMVLNALRLYFNQIDNMGNGLLTGPAGGAYLRFPYIGASDTTDQYALGNDTPTIVQWNTLDYGNGFTLNPNYTATASFSGIYKIDYSLQFANTINSQHDVDVWLRVNGLTSAADVPGSASKFSLPQRKSAGVYSFVVAYSSVVFQLNAGDYVSLWWATDQAYNPVGPVNGVYMEYQAAQVAPFAHPTIPSAVGSITFLSALP